jgi:hypothetical protein
MRHNSIRDNHYKTMTVEEAVQAAPLPIDGDPPRYVVSRIRVAEIPAAESIGEAPNGELVFVPVVDCELHGICICGCPISRN